MCRYGQDQPDAGPRRGGSGRIGLSVLVLSARSGPGRDDQEGQPAHDRHQLRRQHGADGGPDHDADALDDGGGEHEAQHHRPPWVARGEGEDQELALVTELGDEDGAGRDGDGAEERGACVADATGGQ